MGQNGTAATDTSAQDDEYWCPKCASTAIDQTIPDVEAVCEDCGVLITDLADVRSPPELERDDKENSEVPWEDYYTVRNSTEQRVATAFEHLERIGDQLDLSAAARERAAEVYAEAAIGKVTDGRPTETMIAAAIVIACREVTEPRPIAHVATRAGIREESLSAVVRLLSRKLEHAHPSYDIKAYIPFLCRELSVRDEAETTAQKILEDSKGYVTFTGKHPAGIAGAAVYLAVDGAVSQRAIANVAGITGETIRVRLLELRHGGDDD